MDGESWRRRKKNPPKNGNGRTGGPARAVPLLCDDVKGGGDTGNNCQRQQWPRETNTRTARPRQSKLSQEQLAELQKSTHFDKKELQQWYKGLLFLLLFLLPFPGCNAGCLLLFAAGVLPGHQARSHGNGNRAELRFGSAG